MDVEAGGLHVRVPQSKTTASWCEGPPCKAPLKKKMPPVKVPPATKNSSSPPPSSPLTSPFLRKYEGTAHSIQAHLIGGGCAADTAITGMVRSLRREIADLTMGRRLMGAKTVKGRTDGQGTGWSYNEETEVRNLFRAAAHEDAAAAAELLFVSGGRKPLERTGKNGNCKYGTAREQHWL